MATEHAKCSASGSERWLNCRGSVLASLGAPRSSSQYAAQGTVAHQIAGDVLQKGMPDANIFLGKVVSEDGHTITVDEEMVEAVNFYVQVVRTRMAALPGSTLFVEQKFHLTWLNEALYGTNDACIYQKYGKMLVIDLKYGEGIMVSPEENSQLMYYGVGALGEGNPGMVEDVELMIVQPRAKGIRVKTWCLKPEQLLNWGDTVLKPMAEEALRPGAARVPGKWCRFCPAKLKCPEIHQDVNDTAVSVFGEAPLPALESGMPDLSVLSVERLLLIMEKAEMITEFLKAVKDHVREQVEKGDTRFGLKIVAGRKSRRWTDEEKAKATLEMYLDKAAFDVKLKSPAGIEKACKTLGLKPEDLLKGLVIEDHARTMVELADPRPALGTDAASVFAELEN